MTSALRTVVDSVRARRRSALRKRLLKEFENSGRRPWAPGYLVFREDLLRGALADEALIATFAGGGRLPPGYGAGIDERIVEYPWLVSVAGKGRVRALDAGSALNHDFILEQPRFAEKELHIVTLAPEPNLFTERGVSYVYSDLRCLPYRSGWFDEIYSISTLEHVGMDNSLYLADGADTCRSDPNGVLDAARELSRVTRPGGTISFTVPFGRYADLGWYQQFDSASLDTMIEAFGAKARNEAFFRYTADGWQRSTREECADVEGCDVQRTKYFDPASTRDFDADRAAGSRAVAAIRLWM